MLFCEDRTATPLPTHNEHKTSRTFGSLPCFSSSEIITLMCSSWKKQFGKIKSKLKSIMREPIVDL